MPTPTPARDDAAPLLALRDVGVRHAGPDLPGADGTLGPARPAGVSLEVRRGEVVLLLGPSGCGKSTLVLTTDGLVPHVVGAALEGTVAVRGRDTRAHAVADLARDVALVLQDPDAQVVTSSVLDEVCFGPENLLVPADEVLARAEGALRRVGLWERRHDDPGRLSGGGRQRLAVACALALGSPLLVLDEPTAHLDPAGVEEVHAALRDVVAAGEHGVLLVEHSLDAALDLVTRVVVLDDGGRVVADGSPRAVLAGQAQRLHDLGVWLPVSTLAALRLRGAGVVLDPLPLTPRELAAALDAQPSLPAPVPAPPSGVGRDTPGAGGGRGAAGADGRDPVVVVDRLSLRRGRTPVLHDVSLTVRRGELLAVVGPNGAGKTTLAQAVAGVLRAPRRTVTTAGVDPARTDPGRLSARVGFVFQNPEHQLVAGTVEDELAHGLRVRRVPEDEVRARVEDVLDRFGLRAHRRTHPFLLSGGQKRRLSVGTALVCRPEVLVLDEPTSGQDRARAAELLALLDELHRAGTTVVVVTHDLQLVAEHATRVVVVRDGRLVADADPAGLLADETLLRAADLRLPPLAAAARATRRHGDAWRAVTRLAELPAVPRLVGAAR